MNIKCQHIIQKQVIEVEMENPADAFQFRNRLGEVFHEKILPGLEILFDEIGTNNRLNGNSFLSSVFRAKYQWIYYKCNRLGPCNSKHLFCTNPAWAIGYR